MVINDSPNLMRRSQWVYTARIALVIVAYFSVMIFANYLSRTSGGYWAP